MTFVLHPNLAHKDVVCELPLSLVLLEDVKQYPWLLLVPRRQHMQRMMDLSVEDQQLLMVEMTKAQHLLWEVFSPDQINVAAIGNKTPQLHVHVIARFGDDPAWPGTVWDHPTKEPYEKHDKAQLIERLKHAFKVNEW